MKKLFACAIAALVVGAANAINTTWKSPGSGSTTITLPGGWANHPTLVVSITYTIAEDFNQSTTGGASDIFRLGWNDNTSTEVSHVQMLALRKPGNGDPGVNVSFNSGQFANTAVEGLFSAGEHTLTLTFENWSDSNRSLTAKLNDGSEINIAMPENNVTFSANGSLVLWDSGRAGNLEVTVTPEPTVLALLALGVAGMALRRRVA